MVTPYLKIYMLLCGPYLTFTPFFYGKSMDATNDPKASARIMAQNCTTNEYIGGVHKSSSQENIPLPFKAGKTQETARYWQWQHLTVCYYFFRFPFDKQHTSPIYRFHSSGYKSKNTRTHPPPPSRAHQPNICFLYIHGKYNM